MAISTDKLEASVTKAIHDNYKSWSPLEIDGNRDDAGHTLLEQKSGTKA